MRPKIPPRETLINAAATCSCRAAVVFVCGPIKSDAWYRSRWRWLKTIFNREKVPFHPNRTKYFEWMDGQKAEEKLGGLLNPRQEAIRIHKEMVQAVNVREYSATCFMG